MRNLDLFCPRQTTHWESPAIAIDSRITLHFRIIERLTHSQRNAASQQVTDDAISSIFDRDVLNHNPGGGTSYRPYVANASPRAAQLGGTQDESRRYRSRCLRLRKQCSSSAFAQTATPEVKPPCKVQAMDKKLAGAALNSFMKKCESDAATVCDTAAADKKLAGAAKASFTKKCVTEAVGG